VIWHRHHPVDVDRGQATVELALVLPLVAMLTLAIIQVALVARDQNLVTHAAREAARAAAVDADPDVAVRAAQEAGPLDPAHMRVEVRGRDGVGSRVSVTVRYTTRAGVPGLGAAIGDVELDATATMRVER
jgi:Flp pilus assembly protein TadG